VNGTKTLHASPLVPGEVVDATSGAETSRIVDCRARDRLTVRADPFLVAQNSMAVRYGKLVALDDAAREGERPAHSLSDDGGDAVVQRLDGLDVLGKHQGEALAQGWQVLTELSPASTDLRLRSGLVLTRVRGQGRRMKGFGPICRNPRSINDYPGLGFPSGKPVTGVRVFLGIGPSWFRVSPLSPGRGSYQDQQS
jgi:hypothetical protein